MSDVTLIEAVGDLMDTFDAATEQYVHRDWPVVKRLRSAYRREQTRQEWYRMRRDEPSNPRVREMEEALKAHRD